MICHLSLAIAVLNLVLVLSVIRRIERRRKATEAADQALEAILRRPRETTPNARPDQGTR